MVLGGNELCCKFQFPMVSVVAKLSVHFRSWDSVDPLYQEVLVERVKVAVNRGLYFCIFWLWNLAYPIFGLQTTGDLSPRWSWMVLWLGNSISHLSFCCIGLDLHICFDNIAYFERWLCFVFVVAILVWLPSFLDENLNNGKSKLGFVWNISEILVQVRILFVVERRRRAEFHI